MDSLDAPSQDLETILLQKIPRVGTACFSPLGTTVDLLHIPASLYQGNSSIQYSKSHLKCFAKQGKNIFLENPTAFVPVSLVSHGHSPNFTSHKFYPHHPLVSFLIAIIRRYRSRASYWHVRHPIWGIPCWASHWSPVGGTMEPYAETPLVLHAPRDCPLPRALAKRSGPRPWITCWSWTKMVNEMIIMVNTGW